MTIDFILKKNSYICIHNRTLRLLYNQKDLAEERFGGKTMEKSLSIIFKSKPESWGLRGDPYLWCELEQAFAGIPVPCSKACFIDCFEKFFKKLTNYPLNTEGESIFVERYARGGMSSGQVSMEFWRKKALVLLLYRLEKLNLRE